MIMKFLYTSRIDISILSVNFSCVCFIYAEIFEKMSSGGLEVSFSIYKSGMQGGLIIRTCYHDGAPWGGKQHH